MEQTFKDFEICISDDCSTDGRQDELTHFLEDSGLNYSYERQHTNLRYDANLRASITMAKGRYIFLLGNDDALADKMVLEEIFNQIQISGLVGVVITNYESRSNKNQFRRITRAGLLGSGPKTAMDHFRNFSFVSGIVLETSAAQRHATSRWDGSEMYQMFLGCRIIAEGLPLLGIDKVMISEGIKIEGEEVDSYKARPKLASCPIQERNIPLNLFGRVAVDAVIPFVLASQKNQLIENILNQYIFFTYAYWIIEYRRVQSWRFAVGICLGMRPRNIFKEIPLGFLTRFKLCLNYFFVTCFGLLIPIFIFDIFKPILYRIAKQGVLVEGL